MIRFEDLVEKVRGTTPMPTSTASPGLRVFGLRAQGTGAPLGGALYGAPPGSGRLPGGHAAGRGGGRRRPAPRRRRRHPDHHRAHRGAVRPGSRPRRRGRHQDLHDPVLVERGAPGRELPQDAPGDGRRHPRHHRQAGRPAAQHAHAPPPAGGAAHQDRPGDAGHLRAHRKPARDEPDEKRARRALLQVPRAARRTSPSARASPPGAGYRKATSTS